MKTRDIKFRFWTGTIMEEWNHARCWESIGFYLDGGDNYKPMQFTGMLDKDGKEIYDGDIVQNKTQRKNFDNRTGEYEYHLDITTTKDVVKFNKHWCSFEFTKRHEIGELKVLGNIYENPELCEGN